LINNEMESSEVRKKKHEDIDRWQRKDLKKVKRLHVLQVTGCYDNTETRLLRHLFLTSYRR